MSFKKSVKISYLHDNSLERQRTSQLETISKLILMVFTLFCFGSSASKAIGDLFFALDDRQYYCANVVSIVVALLPMLIFMNLSNRENAGKSKWIIRAIVLLVYVISTVLYISTKKEELSEGVRQIRYYVVDAINFYYKLNLSAEWVSSEHLDFTLTVILFCILAVFLYVAILVETRMFLITVPVIFYTGTMSVGYAPKLSSVTYLMLGVFVANMGAWEKYQTAWANNKANKKFNALVMSLMAAIILTMLSTFSLRDKTTVMIEKGAPRLKEIQKELDDKIKNKYEKKIQKLADRYEGEDKESITNREPLYDEKEMFSVEINSKPKANMYFREFYGMRYVGGAWESQRDITESVEKQHHLESGELAQLMNESLKRKTGYYYAEIADVMPYFSGMVDYAKKSKTVWIPDIYEIEDKVNYAGEYLASRKASDENIDFGGYGVTLDFVLENPSFSQKTAGGTYGDYYTWYNSYVEEQYTMSCEKVETAKKIADTLYSYLDKGYTVIEEYGVNARRIQAAYLVSNYLSKATYSLKLNGVAGNIDNVEYFLATSHEGFCIHFASAGAIILQDMGIPARYASGYMLSPSQFERQGNVYRAEALDSDGHAWVEIYLDNIGWFPIEMTSGYGETMNLGDFDLNIENDPNTNQDDEEALNDNKTETTEITTESITSDFTEMTTTEEQIQSPGTTENVTDDNTSLTTESQSSLEGISETSSKTDSKKGSIKNILLVFFILAGVGIIIYLNRRNKHSRKKVYRYVGQDNKKALELINENLVRRVKRKNHLLFNNFSDDEFRKMLIREYSVVDKGNIERYIQIMQKAKFSNHDISEEEVEFCISISFSTSNENKKG